MARRSPLCAGPALLALSLLLWPAAASALPATLTDENAVVQIDPDSQDGIGAWTVNGTAHLRQQWFWLRVGNSGPEASLDTLAHDAPILSDTDGDGDDDTFFTRFLDMQERFTLEMRVVLEGGPFGSPGSGAVADLDTQITLTNISGGALDVTLFQYSDIDLFNTFADDALSLSGSPPNTAQVTDSSGIGRYESVTTPAPDAVQASPFDALLLSLLDGGPSVLDGSLAAAGDVTLGLAWELSLVAGGAFILSQDQSIVVDPVPEPRAALLLLTTLLTLAGGARRARAGGRNR